MPGKGRRSEEQLDSTLIAFPRVGRSVSDQEYYMTDEAAAGEHASQEMASLNSPSSLESSGRTFGKRSRIHIRASKGSMMAFPRVGKRVSSTNEYSKLMSSKVRDYESRILEDDLGIFKANNFM